MIKYTSIKKQRFKKGQGDNIMKKNDIMYEVTELLEIKSYLSGEDQEEVAAAIIRLNESWRLSMAMSAMIIPEAMSSEWCRI